MRSNGGDSVASPGKKKSDDDFVFAGLDQKGCLHKPMRAQALASGQQQRPKSVPFEPATEAARTGPGDASASGGVAAIDLNDLIGAAPHTPPPPQPTPSGDPFTVFDGINGALPAVALPPEVVTAPHLDDMQSNVQSNDAPAARTVEKQKLAKGGSEALARPDAPWAAAMQPPPTALPVAAIDAGPLSPPPPRSPMFAKLKSRHKHSRSRSHGGSSTAGDEMAEVALVATDSPKRGVGPHTVAGAGGTSAAAGLGGTPGAARRGGTSGGGGRHNRTPSSDLIDGDGVPWTTFDASEPAPGAASAAASTSMSGPVTNAAAFVPVAATDATASVPPSTTASVPAAAAPASVPVAATTASVPVTAAPGSVPVDTGTASVPAAASSTVPGNASASTATAAGRHRRVPSEAPDQGGVPWTAAAAAAVLATPPRSVPQPPHGDAPTVAPPAAMTDTTPAWPRYQHSRQASEPLSAWTPDMMDAGTPGGVRAGHGGSAGGGGEGGTGDMASRRGRLSSLFKSFGKKAAKAMELRRAKLGITDDGLDDVHEEDSGAALPKSGSLPLRTQPGEDSPWSWGQNDGGAAFAKSSASAASVLGTSPTPLPSTVGVPPRNTQPVEDAAGGASPPKAAAPSTAPFPRPLRAAPPPPPSAMPPERCASTGIAATSDAAQAWQLRAGDGRAAAVTHGASAALRPSVTRVAQASAAAGPTARPAGVAPASQLHAGGGAAPGAADTGADNEKAQASTARMWAARLQRMSFEARPAALARLPPPVRERVELLMAQLTLVDVPEADRAQQAQPQPQPHAHTQQPAAASTAVLPVSPAQANLLQVDSKEPGLLGSLRVPPPPPGQVAQPQPQPQHAYTEGPRAPVAGVSAAPPGIPDRVTPEVPLVGDRAAGLRVPDVDDVTDFFAGAGNRSSVPAAPPAAHVAPQAAAPTTAEPAIAADRPNGADMSSAVAPVVARARGATPPRTSLAGDAASLGTTTASAPMASGAGNASADNASTASGVARGVDPVPSPVPQAAEPAIRAELRARNAAQKEAKAAAALAAKQATDEAEACARQAQVELKERHRPAVSAWRAKHKDNVRGLLSSLHTVLWADSGWEPVGVADLLDDKQVRKVWMRANLLVHPDKVRQRDGSPEQLAIADMIFDTLKEAWEARNN